MAPTTATAFRGRALGRAHSRLRLLRSLLLAAAAAAPFPAASEVRFEPSLETRLVTSYNSNSNSEIRLWNELSPQLAAGIDTRRIDFDLRYRYSHRIPISGELINDARHSGEGLLRTELLRDLLFLDAQGAATVLNTGFAGGVDREGDNANQQQTFSGSVQPALRRRFGRILVNLRYSYGFLEVDGRAPSLRVGGPFTPNQSLIQGASDTRNQSASASIGNAGRSDRLRWRLSGEYQRDNIDQLDQRFRSKRVVADAEYSLSRSIGLIVMGGYEDIRDVQDSILLDATGFPILDPAGLLQSDPARPTIVNFETSGPTFEGGVRLSPSRRTNLIARAGRRYGDFTASGSLDVELARGLQIYASYQESINNFGRLFTTLFTDPVSGVVTPISSFAGSGGGRTPLGSTTCAFGLDPATGSCLFNLTQVSANASFKDRTAAVTLARTGDSDEADGNARSGLEGSVSAFYTKRSYLGDQPPGLPASANPFSLAGSTDISFGATLEVEQQLGAQSAIRFDLRAQRNQYGLSRDSKDVLLTAQASYDRPLTRNLELVGSIFVTRRWVDEVSSAVSSQRFNIGELTSATASIGLRYLFAGDRGRGRRSSSRPNTPEG